MEKAYAKFYGNFTSIVEGIANEAIEDLTGYVVAQSPTVSRILTHLQRDIRDGILECKWMTLIL